jgi:hypothetical protein
MKQESSSRQKSQRKISPVQVSVKSMNQVAPDPFPLTGDSFEIRAASESVEVIESQNKEIKSRVGSKYSLFSLFNLSREQRTTKEIHNATYRRDLFIAIVFGSQYDTIWKYCSSHCCCIPLFCADSFLNCCLGIDTEPCKVGNCYGALLSLISCLFQWITSCILPCGKIAEYGFSGCVCLTCLAYTWHHANHVKQEKRKKLNDAICLRGAQEIRPRPAEILSEILYEIKDEVNQFDPEERLRQEQYIPRGSVGPNTRRSRKRDSSEGVSMRSLSSLLLWPLH